jgi:hypothetical protein
LRFNANDDLINYVIKKIETNKSNSKKIQKNMFYFQQAIKTKFNNYKEYVFPAKIFCPVNWCCVKEQYFNIKFKSKYGKEFNTIEDILENSIGVHLWENLSINKYKIDFNKIDSNCFFNMLSSKIHNTYSDYKICIPSYKRPQLLQDTTLSLLISTLQNYSTENIYIFLSDDEEEKKYKKHFEGLPMSLNFIKTYQSGIGLTRTFIRQYFPIGTKIIMIDDDIKNIKSIRKHFNLPHFFNEAFRTMEKENVKFCGCCPYDNEYYIKNTKYSTNLKYTGGHLIFEIIRDNPLVVKEKHFEDYIANIEYYKRDGKLLRFNDVYVKTKYYNPNGGIVSTYGNLENRKKDAEKLAYELSEKYKNFCSPYFKKKHKVYNLRLNSFKK